MRARWGTVTIAAAAALVLGGCGGDDADPTPTATVSTPAGFDLPDGVELTEPSTTLDVGDPAQVLLTVGDGATSALTSTVTKITKGDIEDFEFFSLDEQSESSTPYYVTATVENLGPAGIGGTGAPFVAHDDSDTIVPPNVINGTFKPCKSGSLPESFLAGDTAKLCMVFLIPKGRSLVSIDAQSDDPATAVRWKP